MIWFNILCWILAIAILMVAICLAMSGYIRNRDGDAEDEWLDEVTKRERRRLAEMACHGDGDVR